MKVQLITHFPYCWKEYFCYVKEKVKKRNQPKGNEGRKMLVSLQFYLTTHFSSTLSITVEKMFVVCIHSCLPLHSLVSWEQQYKQHKTETWFAIIYLHLFPKNIRTNVIKTEVELKNITLLCIVFTKSWKRTKIFQFFLQ